MYFNFLSFLTDIRNEFVNIQKRIESEGSIQKHIGEKIEDTDREERIRIKTIELRKIQKGKNEKKIKWIEDQLEGYKQEIALIKGAKYLWHINEKHVKDVEEIQRWMNALEIMKLNIVKAPEVNFTIEENDSVNNLFIIDDIEEEDEKWHPPLARKDGHLVKTNFNGSHITISRHQEIKNPQLVTSKNVEFSSYWIPASAADDGHHEATETMHRTRAKKLDLASQRERAMKFLKDENIKELKHIGKDQALK